MSKFMFKFFQTWSNQFKTNFGLLLILFCSYMLPAMHRLAVSEWNLPARPYSWNLSSFLRPLPQLQNSAVYCTQLNVKWQLCQIWRLPSAHFTTVAVAWERPVGCETTVGRLRGSGIPYWNWHIRSGTSDGWTYFRRSCSPLPGKERLGGFARLRSHWLTLRRSLAKPLRWANYF